MATWYAQNSTYFAGTSWNDAPDGSGNSGTPASGDTANTNGYIVYLQGGSEANGITLEGADWGCAGDIVISSTSLIINGSLNCSSYSVSLSGGTIDINSGGTINFGASSSVTLTGGTFSINSGATVDFNLGGTFSGGAYLYIRSGGTATFPAGVAIDRLPNIDAGGSCTLDGYDVSSIRSENLKSGVTIFGIIGSYGGSGGTYPDASYVHSNAGAYGPNGNDYTPGLSALANWVLRSDVTVPAAGKVDTTQGDYGIAGSLVTPTLNMGLYTLTSTIDYPDRVNVAPDDTVNGQAGTMDLPALSAVSSADTLRGEAGTLDLSAYVLKADVVAAEDVRLDTPRWTGATGEGFVGTLEAGTSDWTDDEKAQIRYRLGLDGTATAPTSGAPAIPLGAAEREAIADSLLSRSVAHVEATAGIGSLCYVVLALSNATTAANPGRLTVFRTDGSEFAQRTITSQAGANPITGVTP